VQDKIAQRGRRSRAHYRRPNGEYDLSGLVYCEHCGRLMHAGMMTKRKNGKTYRIPRYVCSTYTRRGRNNETGCGYFSVRQDRLIGAIVDEPRQMLAGSDRAASRVLDAPDDLVGILTDKLAGMKRQLDQAKADLQAAERESQQDAAPARNCLNRLFQLADEIDQADPARRRELFQRLVGRVQLRFEARTTGKTYRYSVAGGTVQYNLSGGPSRGEARQTTLNGTAGSLQIPFEAAEVLVLA
jgi:hypothetical protein